MQVRSTSHGRGFSLIEVLVVVAIIALLVAILVPSLAEAREYARRAACLSNMKSLGSAMSMYLTTYRGWLPVGPADRLKYLDPITRRLYDQPAPGLRPYPPFNCAWGGKRAVVPHDFSTPGRPEVLKRPLTEFLYKGAGLDTDLPVFQCPSDNGFDAQGATWLRPEQRTLTAYQACGNSYYNNPWSDFKQTSPKRLRIPSMLIVIEEAPMYMSVWQRRQLTGWHRQFSRHNLLFLDFHAANLYVDPRTHDKEGNALGPPSRQYQGPDWFAINYFEIMDHYE